MAFGIYVIILLFFSGLFFGLISILIGLKKPIGKPLNNLCDSCNAVYSWYELLPIFSYFLSGGKCNYCDRDISLYYPILELISGLLFSFSFIIYGFSYEMIVMIILTLISIMIFVSDFKYYIILEEPVIIFSAFILVMKFLFFGFKTFLISVASGLLIFSFMLFIRFIGSKIFKQEAIGGGDIKLTFFFGCLLGIKLSILSLVLGSFLAFPYAVYYALAGKQREIPFGPFLITGLFLVFIFMDPIRNFLSIIFL